MTEGGNASDGGPGHGVAEIDAWMDHMFPAGLIRHEGAVVGMWHANGVSKGAWGERRSHEVTVAMRMPRGPVHAGVIAVPTDEIHAFADAPLARSLACPRRGSREGSAKYLRSGDLALGFLAGRHHGVEPVSLLSEDALTIARGCRQEAAHREFGTVDPVVLEAASIASLDRCRDVFVEFAATLPGGIAYVLREFGPQPWMCDLFEDLERGPLVDALAQAPWACPALLSHWRLDRVGFVASVDEGGLDDLVGSILSRLGIPPAFVAAMPLAYEARRHPMPDLPPDRRRSFESATRKGDTLAGLSRVDWLPTGWLPRDKAG